jgi:nitrogen regulatory protein PII-like uncharacterized protein
LFKENIMKFATRLIAASVLATAAAGAFASEYDGVAPDAWLKQTAVSQQVQAPAPVAAAAKADSRVSEQTNQAVTP